MSQQAYPHARDFAWIASDEQGNVGVFITAGEGPIASEALNAEFFPVVEVEPRVLGLSVRDRKGVKMLVKVPRPDSYIDLASRGVYVYDWTDISRGSGHLDAYELMAIPADPIRCDELAGELQTVARSVRLPGVTFGVAKTIAVG
ncbi:hypothetical protein LC55x_4992 [Lysobacter capsici]|jgi:hypothetical protein|uniref:hypothetical protein n=1 Tax=Lysobacter capsici TaxID=435897 RepID=UPI000716643C|nr:hypothetical protein [Lysobacter capsici]ALN88239.1 hypothetical protein LC55x_4992 [Lysobacter capsici]